MRSPPLALQGLTIQRKGRPLLTNVSFTLSPGESIAVMGPSGSGKSTLLACILGVLPPVHGQVVVAGDDVYAKSASARARLRQSQVGTVFQAGELLSELSPIENVAVAALLNGASPRPMWSRAGGLLSALGVPGSERLIGEFSGGERQRVAVARALINNPSLILADEPTGSLDGATRDQVADLLFALPHERGCALLTVTHDDDIAARADRVLTLHEGHLRG